MEHGDGGSLRQRWRSVRFDQLVEWAIQIVGGLAFLHGQNIAHRDIKPDNILISGNRGKIGDFGISKALSTIQPSTTLFKGTPQYLAPELTKQSKGKCSPDADIFSFAILLFEMFSRRDAFPDLSALVPALQIAQGVRPDFPDSDFPSTLRTVIERAWNDDPSQRASIKDILSVLSSLRTKITTSSSSSSASASINSSFENMNLSSDSITMRDQAQQAERNTQQLPSMSVPWQEYLDTSFSLELRYKMVEKIASVSRFSELINSSVREAMKQVPRHCFIDFQLAKYVSRKSQDRISKTFDEEFLNDICRHHDQDDNLESYITSYCHSLPCPATASQVSSAPEIIAAQLSLTPINVGDHVLFIGAKSGYIQTLAAQLVGMNGKIGICTSDQEGMDHLRKVLQDEVPTALSRQVHVFHVNDTQDTEAVTDHVIDEWKKIEDVSEPKFDAIHICGSIDRVSRKMISELLAHNGSLLAPINDSKKSQILTLWQKENTKTVERKLKEWPVIFGKVK